MDFRLIPGHNLGYIVTFGEIGETKKPNFDIESTLGPPLDKNCIISFNKNCQKRERFFEKQNSDCFYSHKFYNNTIQRNNI